jgi:hypothetical protein
LKSLTAKLNLNQRLKDRWIVNPSVVNLSLNLLIACLSNYLLTIASWVNSMCSVQPPKPLIAAGLL